MSRNEPNDGSDFANITNGRRGQPVYYRKATGRPRIEYNDAVEKAIYSGWIDSIVHTHPHCHIDGARKRPAEFRKRLKNFMRMTQ